MARPFGVGAAREIGKALKRKPIALEIPCHRVLRPNGSIGGNRGTELQNDERLKLQRALLDAEGVRSDVDGIFIEPVRTLKSLTQPGKRV